MSNDLAKLFAGHIRTFQERADAALQAAGFEHLLIYSGGLHYGFLDDNPYAFKANPHFKRWVPVTDNPQCLLAYTPGEKPKLAFYSPVDYWHKTHPVPEDFWTPHFDIRPIAKIDEAVDLLPANRERVALIGEAEPVFDAWGVRHRNPETLLNHLHYHFARKTEYEIECVREANRIGARGHTTAAQAFRNGASEYDIHRAYLAACEHTEDQLPYGNIIALNENGATLHYQHAARVAPEARRSFLIDAGATFNGYASDITRTYSAKDDEFRQLIERLDRAQQELCAAVAPGVEYIDLQMRTHRHVAEILAEFGIVKGEPDALVAAGVTRAFYPHGVGHYLGAQVHDVGGKMSDERGTNIPQPESQPFLRLLRTIEIDQVFTIEPGIYFIPSLLDELRASNAGKQVDWERVEDFRPYGGIRIEDNIRVTQDGHENLTRPAFDAIR